MAIQIRSRPIKPVRGDIDTRNPMQDLGNSVLQIAKQTGVDINNLTRSIDQQAKAKDDLDSKLEEIRIRNKMKSEEENLETEIQNFEDKIISAKEAWSEEKHKNEVNQKINELEANYLMKKFSLGDTGMATDMFYPLFLKKMNDLRLRARKKRWDHIIQSSYQSWEIGKQSIANQVKSLIPNDFYFEQLDGILIDFDSQSQSYNQIDPTIVSKDPGFRQKLETMGWYNFLLKTNDNDKIQVFNKLIYGKDKDYIDNLQYVFPGEIYKQIKPEGEGRFGKSKREIPSYVVESLRVQVEEELKNESNIRKYNDNRILSNRQIDFDSKKVEFKGRYPQLREWLENDNTKRKYETYGPGGADLYEAHVKWATNAIEGHQGRWSETKHSKEKEMMILFSQPLSYVTDVNQPFWLPGEEAKWKNYLVSIDKKYENGMSLNQRYVLRDFPYKNDPSHTSKHYEIAADFEISEKHWSAAEKLIHNKQDKLYDQIAEHVKKYQDGLSGVVSNIDIYADVRMQNITNTIYRQAKAKLTKDSTLTWDQLSKDPFSENYLFQELDNGKYDTEMKKIIDDYVGSIDRDITPVLSEFQENVKKWVEGLLQDPTKKSIVENWDTKTRIERYLKSDEFKKLIYIDPELDEGLLQGQRDHNANMTPFGKRFREYQDNIENQ